MIIDSLVSKALNEELAKEVISNATCKGDPVSQSSEPDCSIGRASSDLELDARGPRRFSRPGKPLDGKSDKICDHRSDA